MSVVGDGVADFDARADVVFPALTLQGGRGYYFLVSSQPVVSVPSQQYISMFARYSSGANLIETKMLAKFFSNGAAMMFVVPVPDFSFMPASYSVRVIGRPKEFYRGSGTLRTMGVRLSRDDSKVIGGFACVP